MQSVALLVVLVLFVAFVISKPVSKDGGANVDKGFEAWKTQFGKSYASAEEESGRKSIWLVNKKMIEEHNKRAENGLESYTMGLDFFSDLESPKIPEGLNPLQGVHRLDEPPILVGKKTCELDTDTTTLPSTNKLDRAFEKWKKRLGKTYASAEEEARRKQLWLKNKKSVTEHNIQYDKGLVTWRMGMNQFSDMLPGEDC